MNIVVSIEHPAWVHQFREIIKQLQHEGHKIQVLAIKKDINIELLEKFNISYILIAYSTGRNILEKAWLLVYTTLKYYLESKRFKADIFIGRASPMLAITSFLQNKPHIIFEDTDHAVIGLFFCKLFSNEILTNTSFRKNLGGKQVLVDTYKELFYLHPDQFRPDQTLLSEIGLNPDKPYFIIRFVAWQADHDFGHSGLTIDTKRLVISGLKEYGKVLITSEKPLPDEFEQYRISLSPEKIHHLIYYASFLYGESATMATEAAVLGTHAVYLDFTGRGYTDELEQKYDLVYNFKLDQDSQQKSIEKAIKLAKISDLKAIGKEKRKKLLSEKMNGTKLMLEEIKKYF
jgi:predicted glycosyltransferase